jgi:hypothetical protein
VRNFARDEEPILGGFIRDAYYFGEGERLKKRVALLDGERACTGKKIKESNHTTSVFYHDHTVE